MEVLWEALGYLNTTALTVIESDIDNLLVETNVFAGGCGEQKVSFAISTLSAS
ncbi:hypothetical protein P3339_04205 [Microbulbifer sp. MLAF003]|uniref:hypothetical protein n=1 Tax=unclassified Microbulbifer TaxID=2619833 RepID=UPI0024ACFC01|nr:hypothetical protein [Microbulbifer sp. MLAF003]WHI52031.1 hypothetical protein P3339_04205 [Microbulbifer sp. MLAF003]